MQQFIHQAWHNDTLQALKEFIKLPCKSKDFDPKWEQNKLLLVALEQAQKWGEKALSNASFEVVQLPGLPPVLFFDIPATGKYQNQTILFYGHFDKQPETQGWMEGLGPWQPMVKDHRLYGRGSVDDGYNFYSVITAIQALERTNTSHPRICGLFETDEESGSTDLGLYLDNLKERIGQPIYIGILDLFANDFNRVWLTQSLRGVISLVVKVSVLKESVHSGLASGIVPSPFRILRTLLDRIEDAQTGHLRLPSLFSKIPDYCVKPLKDFSNEHDVRGDFNFLNNVQASESSSYDALVAGTWHPTMSVLGIDGLPATETASALIHDSTAVKLSFRIPPGVDSQKALQDICETLTSNPPYNAKVEISQMNAHNGFNAPSLPTWLSTQASEFSNSIFEHPLGWVFCGASIGTLPLFQQAFPNTVFLNTGALGPNNNAHAPNEWLDLVYVEKLTLWLAKLIASTPDKES